MNESRVAAVQPQRGRDGYWTHPHYFSPAGDAEGPGEFNAWLSAQSLECRIHWMHDEAPPGLISAYRLNDGRIRHWEPSAPPGTGWFIGSLHDTAQGAVCIWLRRTTVPAHTRTAAAR